MKRIKTNKTEKRPANRASVHEVVSAGSPCEICKKPITGILVSMNDGWAHSACYEREYPPRVCLDLYHVARGGSDPVLAAEVIAEMVPKEVGDRIVQEYNRRLMKLWLRRCEH